LSGTLTITQQGSSLAGTLSTELGSGPLTEGQLSGNSVSFAGSVSVGGQTVPFTVKATVAGTRLSGTIDSTQGSFALSGTKNP